MRFFILLLFIVSLPILSEIFNFTFIIEKNNNSDVFYLNEHFKALKKYRKTEV